MNGQSVPGGTLPLETKVTKQYLTMGRIVIYHIPSSEQWKNNQMPDCPAVVVQVWSDTCANLRVLYDGVEVGWATSATEGPGQYQWSWPERSK